METIQILMDKAYSIRSQKLAEYDAAVVIADIVKISAIFKTFRGLHEPATFESAYASTLEMVVKALRSQQETIAGADCMESVAKFLFATTAQCQRFLSSDKICDIRAALIPEPSSESVFTSDDGKLEPE